MEVTMRSGKLLLTALTGAALISCAEPTGPTTAAMTGGDEVASSERGRSSHILKNIDVTGIVTEGGTFAGMLTITRFDWVGDAETGQLMASGILNGFVTDEDGNKQHVREEFTAPATLSREATVAALGADADLVRPVAQASCDVLFLDLGPLHLDLLGLTVDLSQIVLDINAVTGGGNLLGNLLCGLLGILDGFPILANILAILENINAILSGIGGLFPAA
jgi:hypothetical protein